MKTLKEFIYEAKQYARLKPMVDKLDEIVKNGGEISNEEAEELIKELKADFKKAGAVMTDTRRSEGYHKRGEYNQYMCTTDLIWSRDNKKAMLVGPIRKKIKKIVYDYNDDEKKITSLDTVGFIYYTILSGKNGKATVSGPEEYNKLGDDFIEDKLGTANPGAGPDGLVFSWHKSPNIIPLK